jgi:hypothetical protein
MTSEATARHKARFLALQKYAQAVGLDPLDPVVGKAFAAGFNAGRKYERRLYEIVPATGRKPTD